MTPERETRPVVFGQEWHEAFSQPREDDFTSTVEGAAAFERDRAERAGENRGRRINGRWYDVDDLPTRDEL